MITRKDAKLHSIQLAFQQDLEILQSQITAYLPMITRKDAKLHSIQLAFQQDLEILQSQITAYLPMITRKDAKLHSIQLTFQQDPELCSEIFRKCFLWPTLFQIFNTSLFSKSVDIF